MTTSGTVAPTASDTPSRVPAPTPGITPTLTIHVTAGTPHVAVIDAGPGVTVTHTSPAAIGQVIAATVEAHLTGALHPAA